jgi:hypothetical protein
MEREPRSREPRELLGRPDYGSLPLTVDGLIDWEKARQEGIYLETIREFPELDFRRRYEQESEQVADGGSDTLAPEAPGPEGDRPADEI